VVLVVVRYNLHPQKNLLKLIFASCYIRLNTVMTKLHISTVRFTVLIFRDLKYYSCFTSSRVCHVVAIACGNYTLRLWNIIQLYNIDISILQFMCVCVFCVLSGKRINKVAWSQWSCQSTRLAVWSLPSRVQFILTFCDRGTHIKCRTAFPLYYSVGL
jgi:WD40 repeat protein